MVDRWNWQIENIKDKQSKLNTKLYKTENWFIYLKRLYPLTVQIMQIWFPSSPTAVNPTDVNSYVLKNQLITVKEIIFENGQISNISVKHQIISAVICSIVKAP